MTRSPSVLRSALALMSVRLVLQQIGLALLVFALTAIWLRIPDASLVDVIGSALLALIVLAIAGAGESAIILRLSGHARTPARLLRGALLLLAGAVLWVAWSMQFDHIHSDDYLRAGYLNSRFPHSLRNFFSFQHILLWLGWMWTALQWIGAGVIALLVFTATASIGPLHAMMRALRSFTYWIVVVLGAMSATVLTSSLMHWTPGHGLRIEALGLALRLSLALLVDGIVVGLVLAILAVCVRRTDALYIAPTGTPDESQPRTTDNP
jgi:hypothetical protein